MLRMRAVVVAALVTLGVAGCGGSSGGSAQGTPTAGSGPAGLPTPSACPSPTTTASPDWPASVPDDLPKPAGARIEDTTVAQGGVHVTRFVTPTSLRQAVLFVVESLPKAGYVLGRGDAEANEADAPFVHGQVRGLYRMVDLGGCRTQWLLATVDTKSAPTSPLLPSRSPSGSPSPLPFG